MDYEARMQKALGELRESDTPNFTAVAENNNLVRTTLSRRYKSQTRSRHDFIEQESRLLTDAQEDQILEEIDCWSKRGLHFTPRILRNVVEELLHEPIGEKWVSRFVQRHSTRIKSLYLKGFDKERQIADNPANIKTFYGMVRDFNL
jgi:hypothetical protein